MIPCCYLGKGDAVGHAHYCLDVVLGYSVLLRQLPGASAPVTGGAQGGRAGGEGLSG